MSQASRSGTQSRRSILKAAAAGCGMMTQTSVMSTLLNLQATKAAAADANPTGDYKALVCLFLFGGNDSYNMLVPRNNAASAVNPLEYDHYATSRGGYDDGNNNPGGLALEEEDLLAIFDPTNLTNRSFGLHPGFGSSARIFDDTVLVDDGEHGLDGGIAKLYQDGNLAFVANIGSLIGPTTRADYDNRANLPLGIFSHSDLQRHWMTGVPQSRSQITGWGGRMSDLLQAANENPTVSMNISINGTNLFQTGGSVVPYVIGQNGATQVSYYNTGNLQNRIFSKCTDSILDQTYSNLLAKSLADLNRNSIDAAVDFNINSNAVTIDTPFDSDSLSQRFKKIAQVIGAHEPLQQSRQVFFISIGGFDNHSGLLPAQANLLPQVSRALKSFYDATVELGCQDDVVTFTASDFARTLSTNGQGSDHAWGGNHLVLGGGVRGGQIFGDFPTSLSTPSDVEFGNLNLGRGRLLPTTSVDEMAAELAMWFGVSGAAELKTVLPNIESFYTYSPGQGPLCFLI